jgi:hypothetical protein
VSLTSLAAALAVKTDDQNITEIAAAVAAAGVDSTGMSPFSVSVAMPAVFARSRTVEQSIRATLVRAGLGDYAADIPDAWVDQFAKSSWDLDRLPATKARFLWPVTATGAVTSGARTLIADGGTSLFENVAAVNIGAGATALVEFEARTAGTDGNVAVGAVTGFQVGKAGLSISSPAGSMIVAGRPKESSVDLWKRGRAKLPASSIAGNSAAFDLWIPTAAPTVNRWAVDDTNPDGPGTTRIYVANAAGPATVDELAALLAYLTPRRGKGTGAIGASAAPAKTLSFGCVMHVSNNAAAATQGAAALQALSAVLPLGGGPKRRFYLDSARDVLLAVPGVYELTFSGIAEETKLDLFEVITLNATLSVVP